MSDEQPALRVAIVGIVVVSLFAALFARLYYLQVLRKTTVEEVFGGPRLREVAYQGTRGRILDRAGNVLVDNRESIVVTIDRRQYESVQDKAALQLRLARALNDSGVPTKVADIAQRIEDPRYDPLKPVPIAEDVSHELEVYLLERLAQFPSVDVVRQQIRTYPNGQIAAHVLGYTGAINSDELEARKSDPKGYQPGDDIGKAGAERVFESELRAVPGKRTVEVDATEREIGTRSDVPSIPGNDLELTIDLNLQRSVEASLKSELDAARKHPLRKPTDPELRAPAGAVVVLDAKTSEVLALASYPTYDPAEFIGGISAYRFNELNDPRAFFPFTNRAIQSLYSPGSTFKPFTAVAALERGVISADETITDRGSYTLDKCTDACVFSNAGGTSYGKIDLAKALTVSSDVYFYRLGERMWVDQAAFGQDAIQQTARQFGLGTATGVQLPGEASGLISDPAFKKARHDENPDAFPFGEWFTGDNVNLAIGQGDVGVTPLQLANAYAALANGGVLHAPSVAKALVDHDTGAVTRSYAARQLGTVDLPPAIRQPIADGLAGVVADDAGTAYGAFQGFPLAAFPVAGKTGTAEAPPRADTAIFAAFGPVEDPRYVVVSVMEESGFAAETAAPLVRKVFEQLSEVRPLLPIATTPTPATKSPTDPGPGATSDSSATAERSTATSAPSSTGGGADSGSQSTPTSAPRPATAVTEAVTTTAAPPPVTTTEAPAAPPSTAPVAPTAATVAAAGAPANQSASGTASGLAAPIVPFVAWAARRRTRRHHRGSRRPPPRRRSRSGPPPCRC